jgi:cell pole-organizing protein PopZ
MSDAKNPQQEPSMEEILASIRRIISEDGEAGKEPPAMPPAAAAPAAVLPPEPAKPAEKPAEILELTEMVSDDGKVTNLSAQAVAPPPPPAPPPSPEPAPPAATAAAAGEGLISATTAAAAASSLASLQAMAKEPESETPAQPRSLALGEGSLTIEDIVREELRPILQSWLDENLPGMVERLVQKEIRRITRNVDGS